jgi:hypothetical protein
MDDQDARDADVPERPYGRVTTAARFAIRHSVALELLDRLPDE